MRKLIGIVFVSVLFCSGFSNAAVVVMDFRFFDVDFTALGSPVTSDVVFRVSYDSAAPDVNSGPNVGFYDANVTLRSGAQAAGPVRTRVSVIDDVSGNDKFQLQTTSFTAPFPLFQGVPIERFNLTLETSAGDMFSSQALPVTPDFAADATLGSISLGPAIAPVSYSFLPGSFEVTLVPEPVTSLFLMAGLATLLVVLRGADRRANLHALNSEFLLQAASR